MLLFSTSLYIAPTISLGPLELSWHGIMIAIGTLIGLQTASWYLHKQGRSMDPLWTIIPWVGLSAVIGAKLLYLILHNQLGNPAAWIDTQGFAFSGALIAGGAVLVVYMYRSSLSLSYLDALAFGFPIAMAIGRIGDIIVGEHTGPRTDAPWGIAYTHPDTLAPSLGAAYHSGALYEMLMVIVLGALAWRWRHALAPGIFFWLIIGGYGLGRFCIFFYRNDTDPGVLLNQAQWVSIAIVITAAAGIFLTHRWYRVKK